MKIIAEAGVNFFTLKEAYKFIDKSKKLGLFATKFQIYNREIIRDHPNRGFLETIMIDKQTASKLLQYGRDIEQNVFFSVMYPEAVDWLEELGVEMYKVRFYDRHNFDLYIKIKNIANLFFRSVNDLATKFGNEKLLFCSPKYPSKLNDYKFSIRYGYDDFIDGISDHTPDLELLKICLEHNNYEYFEKHVCLTKDCLEADWSSTFDELEEVLK